jgi:hypothetical protein
MITREQQGALRAGRITGTAAQRIMTGSRSSWNKIAEDLRNPRPFYNVEDSPNMPEQLAWGQRTERQAAGYFWDRHPEYDVLDPKFIYWHDPSDLHRLRHFGFSPDRMLSRAGFDTPIAGLELKCPFDGEVHAATIKGRALPLAYKWQIYHGLYVSNLPEWWFVSFDPRVEDETWRYFELRIIPDPADMQKLRDTLNEFLDGYTMGETFSPRNATAKDFAKWF